MRQTNCPPALARRDCHHLRQDAGSDDPDVIQPEYFGGSGLSPRMPVCCSMAHREPRCMSRRARSMPSSHAKLRGVSPPKFRWSSWVCARTPSRWTLRRPHREFSHLRDPGGDQALFLTRINSINGPTQPAAKGTIVTIYATGEGQTNPPSVTGTISGSVLKMPVAGVNDWRANGSGSLCRIGTRYGGGRVAGERTCSRQRGLRFCCAGGPHSRWRKQPIRCNHRGAVES